jgi:hypothetical protein
MRELNYKVFLLHLFCVILDRHSYIYVDANQPDCYKNLAAVLAKKKYFVHSTVCKKKCFAHEMYTRVKTFFLYMIINDKY